MILKEPNLTMCFGSSLKRKVSLGLLAVVLLSTVLGCASREQLVPHPAVASAPTNFSGNWKIRPQDSATEQRVTRVARKISGVKFNRSARRRAQGDAGLALLFLELGKKLKVTQTDHGLFISFDRSVVEEYRFGEDRLLRLGEVEVQRVSGWDATAYVIETLDKNSTKLSERVWLSNGDEILNRKITIRNRKLEEQFVLQRFDRVD